MHKCIVISVCALTACTTAPDISSLPGGITEWCCDKETCFAGSKADDFPSCLNFYEYGARAFSFDMGHSVAGTFVSCRERIREALKRDPSAFSGEHTFDPGSAIDSCLPMFHVEAREAAYLFTFFDKRDESQNFRAFPSKYYCDQARDAMKDEDALSKVSTCKKATAHSPASRSH